MTEREIFIGAIQLDDPVQRRDFVRHAAASDAGLHERLEGLLSVYEGAASFPASPIVRPQTRGARVQGESQGDIVGPYKLLQQIGEGGMGVVWMAEQSRPVQRVVALKIIKPGMDTRLVVARFEQEREALALMDHPNIARVLDAGTVGPSSPRCGLSSKDASVSETTSCGGEGGGRPYFVMELVKGVPITQYCDEHRLAPRERLRLFLDVAHAVQHAHQKGIIHRDLKPSNVLIAEYDDKPVAKIIDFGIAKAIGSKLTDATLFTAFGALVGTLEYMSPEQAKLNALDIDTRSDVYSLGVLLYELLTGTTPLSRDRLKTAAFDECLRIIREEEPPKPSTRLCTLGLSRPGIPVGQSINSETPAEASGSRSTSSLGVVCALRHIEPARLTKLVRGELDWIVMKCLEKDRNRRYETANGLATDLQRYLDDEPVQACPPSAGYRLRKLARRHKGAVLAVVAIFLLLCAGISGTSWGLVREADQRRLAEAAFVSEHKAKEAEAQHRTLATESARKATREAATAAAINDFLNRDVLGVMTPNGQANQGLSPNANLNLRGVLQRAAKRIDGKFPSEPEVEMRLRYTLGCALGDIGDYTGALPQFEKVVALSEQLRGRNDAFTLSAEYRFAGSHAQLKHFEVALPLLEQNVARQQAALGQGHIQTLQAMNGLALAYHHAGQLEKALRLAEETLELRKRHFPRDGYTLVGVNNVAAVHLRMGHVDQALPLAEEALAGMKEKFGPLHPERLNTTRLLAETYQAAEQPDKALPLLELVVRQYKTAFGRTDPNVLFCIDQLLGCYVDLAFCDKAAAQLTSILPGGESRPDVVDQRQATREKRGRELIQQVKPAAEKYQQALAAKGTDHPETLAARQEFAVVLREQKRLSAAAYHLKAVLDSRQRLGGGDVETQATRIELGATRLSQKRYAEAEPLLLEAYAVSKQLEGDRCAPAALAHLVQLYDAWDKKEKATEWRQKLDQQKKR